MRLIAGIGILAILAACGGGGDASTTSTGGGTGTTTTTGGGAGGTTTTTTGGTTTTSAVVDKYIGTWVSCKATGASSSEQETLVLQKASDTTVNTSSSVKSFPNTTCSGTGTAAPTDSGTATWVGTKLVGSETVDEINIVQGAITIKQIVVIRSDGKLYSGVEASSGGSVDANGYPTTLEATGSTKTA
jgi:hypothetical protein